MSTVSYETNEAPPELRSTIWPWQVADLILVAELMILLPGLLFLPWPWLRIPLGIFAVLLAPGYALTAALFVGREDLDGIERAGLSIGLSVALIPPLALVLDWLPWGIRPMPIAIGLAVTTCTFCVIAGVRRHLHRDPYKMVPYEELRLRTWRMTPAGMAAVGALIVVVVWATIVYTVILTTPTRFTEFYALGAGGLAEDYPRVAVVGEPVTVTLGINNEEGATRTYRIEVQSSEESLASVGPFEIADGMAWTKVITFAVPTPGNDQEIDILLFTHEDPEPYRQLRLWLDVRGQP